MMLVCHLMDLCALPWNLTSFLSKDVRFGLFYIFLIYILLCYLNFITENALAITTRLYFYRTVVHRSLTSRIYLVTY